MRHGLLSKAIFLVCFAMDSVNSREDLITGLTNYKIWINLTYYLTVAPLTEPLVWFL
jgi:hypothetical protein